MRRRLARWFTRMVERFWCAPEPARRAPRPLPIIATFGDTFAPYPHPLKGHPVLHIDAVDEDDAWSIMAGVDV